MHLLSPSQFIFPDPMQVDPEGEGLICIGADLSPSTLLPVSACWRWLLSATE